MNQKSRLGVIVGFCLLPLLQSCQGKSAPPQARPSAPSPAAAIHWEKYSDALFARAKKENRFILLDLEAVWCHWCHVQDEITYTDPKVIALINARYIAVKVDQDSRPDLSNRYEDYGWPATIVLNADGRDIVRQSGYVPPTPMARMLQAIIDDPTPGPSVRAQKQIEFGSDSALGQELRDELISKLNSNYDGKEGGWGVIHKFIDWDAVEYSLGRARAGDSNAEHRARQTLDGGLQIIDPVWGGVYQYSTDGDWKHPHFEKLLQFQAEIMRIYAMGYAQFRDERYLKAAGAIRGYIASFLTSPQGAFYVSQDADLVQGEHSAGYFAIDDAGRRKLGVPRVDTHCYARENGWAIRGLLAYYDISREPNDLRAAEAAAKWIEANRALPNGGFRHDEHDAAGPYLADTLAMGRAYLALYESTANRDYLAKAQSAADFIWQTFKDHGAGKAGFVTAVSPAADPLAPGPQLDENVWAARFYNLLFHYTGRPRDQAAAAEAMRYLATPQIARSRNLWMAGLLLADGELSTEPLHVTVVGKKEDAIAAKLFCEALQAPTAYRRIEWYDASEGPLPHADVEYPQLPKAAAFVCTGHACSSPMTTVESLDKKLGIRRN